jgi:hypothetical protein
MLEVGEGSSTGSPLPEQPIPAPVERPPRDLLGWACLLVVLPPLWVIAPLVVLFTGVRLARSENARGPTFATALISFVISLFLIWYFTALVRGASP